MHQCRFINLIGCDSNKRTGISAVLSPTLLGSIILWAVTRAVTSSLLTALNQIWRTIWCISIIPAPISPLYWSPQSPLLLKVTWYMDPLFWLGHTQTQRTLKYTYGLPLNLGCDKSGSLEGGDYPSVHTACREACNRGVFVSPNGPTLELLCGTLIIKCNQEGLVVTPARVIEYNLGNTNTETCTGNTGLGSAPVVNLSFTDKQGISALQKAIISEILVIYICIKTFAEKYLFEVHLLLDILM